MKTIEEFYHEAKANDAVQKAFDDAFEAGKADEFLKENGVSGTAKELEEYIRDP